MTQVIFPVLGDMPEPDAVYGKSDNRTNYPKSEQISKNVEPYKSVTSIFDDSIFLINKTTGTLNKSIGFTRKEVAGLLPKMQQFLTQDDAS